jgi:hypothetical protein
MLKPADDYTSLPIALRYARKNSRNQKQLFWRRSAEAAIAGRSRIRRHRQQQPRQWMQP